MTAPALVVCAHGTRDPHGRRTVLDLIGTVADRLPGVEVREAYVDVHGPALPDVVASLGPSPDEGPAGVVVPLLLAAGYHVRVDLAEAVAARPDVLAAPALGPDDRLVEVVAERIGEADVPPEATLILVAAGSSDPAAQADSRETADRLSRRLGRPVRLAFAAGPHPRGGDAVTAARAEGAACVALASYLLAPGFFQGRLERCGADRVTAPLLPDGRVADIVIERYHAAVATLLAPALP